MIKMIEERLIELDSCKTDTIAEYITNTRFREVLAERNARVSMEIALLKKLLKELKEEI
jgi:hypothetical protein